MQAGQSFEDGFAALNAFFMTDGVLRHGIRPASDAVKQRLGFESHNASQLPPRGFDERVVCFRQSIAAHETAEKHQVIRYTMVELVSNPGAGCHVFPLFLRHQEPKALERMVEGRFSITQPERE